MTPDNQTHASGRTEAEEASSPPALGDPREWVDQHADALYRYALLRLRDVEQAEEAVQECFLAALKAHERFEGRASVRTWLIGILKRKVFDRMRAVSRQREREATEAEELEATESGQYFSEKGLWQETPARWNPATTDSAERREFWGAFQRCLAKLPPKLADAFVLCELDQLDGEEVCHVLELTATNLWTRLHRARLALRACLEKKGFGRPKNQKDRGRRT
jgi:RNA polymerase sigma-70 factor (ECF subfamily)